MKKIHRLSLLSCLVATFFVTPAYAQWQLENDHSNLDFISIKKTSIAEVHQFKKLSGSVSDEGDIHLLIDLSSVDTQNDIRNERLKAMLFEVAQFPTAEFNGNVDMSKVDALKVGETLDMPVNGKLSMHGVVQDSKTILHVVKLSGNQIQVTTKLPIILNADSYGLAAGIEKLREAAGLPVISAAVPVTFDLVFKHLV
ncbi:MAG: YceI family protein [Betaproteobacteria bacterium]|nr:YceI family protein [Betaproteobacteria bacterium]